MTLARGLAQGQAPTCQSQACPLFPVHLAQRDLVRDGDTAQVQDEGREGETLEVVPEDLVPPAPDSTQAVFCWHTDQSRGEPLRPARSSPRRAFLHRLLHDFVDDTRVRLLLVRPQVIHLDRRPSGIDCTSLGRVPGHLQLPRKRRGAPGCDSLPRSRRHGSPPRPASARLTALGQGQGAHAPQSPWPRRSAQDAPRRVMKPSSRGVARWDERSPGGTGQQTP